MADISFSRVAVLNRGEAAVRFIRAARSWSRQHDIHLGVVAFYTNEDATALFVRMASSAVPLGDALVAAEDGTMKSAYVDVERMVRLVKASGADAVWPGWGFLAESPELADACEKAGIVFLGPSAHAMRLLGDKIAAKRLAEEQNVSVSPWSREPVKSAEEAAEHADRIGFPVLLKAAAGGGGRGIRVVQEPGELAEAFRGASTEAAQAFGDPSVFVEAFVSVARHVEVQVLADKHDNVWALGTRDCSAQRRHQKVVEEAPAPDLHPQVESELCRSAIAMARGCGYVGAGTAEFLLLPDGKTFYFLEMNTRLQVEHTVSEEIFGVDLVGAQIDIAMGAALPAAGPPEARGVAVQARLNAEDPDDGFAPRAGRLRRLSLPEGPGIRVDSGYQLGSVIPPCFDSNIAKIIAWGGDRRQAMARLQTALRDTIVAVDSGLTNRSLLHELVAESKLKTGPVTTRWLDEFILTRTPPGKRRHLEIALSAAAIGDHVRARRGHLANFFEEAGSGVPRSVPDPTPSEIRYELDGHGVTVSVATLGLWQFRVQCGDWEAVLAGEVSGESSFILELDGRRYWVIRVATASEVHCDVDGVAHRFRRASDGRVRASLPASVSQIHVAPGDQVAAGQRLVTLEVMKMEMPVEAPVSGTVTALHVRPAGQVAAGDLLVEIEEGADDGEAQQPDTPAPELPSRETQSPSPVEILRARLLGFDIAPEEAEQAASRLHSAGDARPRQELLDLLQTHVIQDLLFRRGPYDDARNGAGESSLEQLSWFVHHRRLDEDRLSPRFVRRLRRFLALHGIQEPKRSLSTETALLRLFQSRSFPRELDGHVLAILQCLAGMEREALEAPENNMERMMLEKLANSSAEQGRRHIATATWNLIYRWYDVPEQLKEHQTLVAEAEELLDELLAAEPRLNPDSSRYEWVLSIPTSCLLAAARDGDSEDLERSHALLQLLLQQLHEVEEQRVLKEVQVGRTLKAEDEVLVAGVLLRTAEEWQDAVGSLPPGADLDVILAFDPEAHWLVQAAELAGDRGRVTFLWSTKGGGFRSRTFAVSSGQVQENESLQDLHPCRPVAREVERFSGFDLTRLPAEGGLSAFRARARDANGNGDQRLVILGEVERFDVQVEGELVRAPGFEKTFLDAVQTLRSHLASGSGRNSAWNRIVLYIRPELYITRREALNLVRRLAPSTLDLALEKVVLVGRFRRPGDRGGRTLAARWTDPAAAGPRLSFSTPGKASVKPMSAYQQRALAARRRGLFDPYDLVSWVASRDLEGSLRQGRFEEMDLDEDGTGLVSVAGRDPGENKANLVIGEITNRTPKLPGGLRRALIVGDPTRSMGSLGEAECRRIIAVLDHAEARRLPVEWVALSSGARISFDSGTENLDWTAATLRRIVEFTQDGGVINIIVDGPCVGAQSYWNAEATMLMHCRGALVMTPKGYMVLTGKKALEYSGSVSAATNQGIGGLEIMEPNGEAQYVASDLHEAYDVLFRHYDYTYQPPDQVYVPAVATSDSPDRDPTRFPYQGIGGFRTVGEVLSDEGNPSRKKPFAIREIMASVLDRDAPPLERWAGLDGGETAVVLLSRVGGQPVTLVGIESMPLARKGRRPLDGPESWMSGSLFPESSRKVARAITAASGLQPVVVLANLSGFDGSPESLRNRQLEYGAEIGRAVVNFRGPIIFCVIGRYHGGAYVVFSQRLSEGLHSSALEGTYASVIGGAPAAAVVFPRLVQKRTLADSRVQAARKELDGSEPGDRGQAQQSYEEVLREVEAETQAAVAQEFDEVHSVGRAQEVGSLSAIILPSEMRTFLVERVLAGAQAFRGAQDNPEAD